MGSKIGWFGSDVSYGRKTVYYVFSTPSLADGCQCFDIQCFDTVPVTTGDEN